MTTDMTNPQNPLLVGVITAAQGIRGEVRVKPFTGEPDALADFGVLFDKAGNRFEVLSARAAKAVAVVRFLGVNDRNQAESLRGTELYIDRSSLPFEELEENEYFHADLEGLEAYDSDGKFWGVITGIFDFGGGDLLELQRDGERPVIIPFTLAAVLVVDLDGGRILVDPLAAGLLDDGATPEPGGGDGYDDKKRDTDRKQ